ARGGPPDGLRRRHASAEDPGLLTWPEPRRLPALRLAPQGGLRLPRRGELPPPHRLHLLPDPRVPLGLLRRPPHMTNSTTEPPEVEGQETPETETPEVEEAPRRSSRKTPSRAPTSRNCARSQLATASAPRGWRSVCIRRSSPRQAAWRTPPTSTSTTRTWTTRRPWRPLSSRSSRRSPTSPLGAPAATSGRAYAPTRRPSR